MKISLALGPRRPVSRQTAVGCLTANLALPGSGSLLAGRRSGYAQMALAVGGMGLTLLFGLRFMIWSITNWARLHDPQADFLDMFEETWLRSRWALLGIGLFVLGWLWALATSMAIVRSAGENPSNTPPRLR
jgi:hypothetical protein